MRGSWTAAGLRTCGAIAAAAGLVAGLSAAGRQAKGTPGPGTPLPLVQQRALVQQYCATCHTEAQKPGGLSLERFAGADHTPANIAAMMVRKLKAGQMPPPGMPHPDEPTMTAFIAALQAAAIPGMAAAAGVPAPAVAAAGPQIVSFPHTGTQMTIAAQNAMVHQICTQCHTDQRKPGGVSFVHFDMATAPQHAELAEDMIAKLRAGMMPPMDAPKRPDRTSIDAFVASLESRIDRAAALHPNPGFRLFQRLNRAEYASAIHTMLGLDVDVSKWLPPDTMSHNFDNISAVEGFSPTLLESYLEAADAISRLAVGDTSATPESVSYSEDNFASQMHYVSGAPMGTRGGISIVHVFPADGQYRFRMLMFDTPLGVLFGSTTVGQQLEVSIDGRRVALLDVDPRMSETHPPGLTLETPPIDIQSGPHRISAVFLKQSDGPIDDIISPHDFTLADANIGSAPGITALPHLRDLTINGPFSIEGLSNTVSRQKIFICRPTSAADEVPCATRIVSHLAEQAYRRPATPTEVADLMKFYAQGRAHGDFESGIRMALQALLASTHFLFRIEEQPATVAAGQNYRISDVDLASRLSYFLWSAPPDAELIKVASADRLHLPAVLDAQVRRMLKDPRAMALSTRFAAEWLRLQDVDKMHPDALLYANYDQTLGADMKRETELFFNSIVREDRSVLDLLTAKYTYVNNRLARFYGIPGVPGPDFTRVSLAGTPRQGLLGQGSILVLTSVGDRTSPVQRGKWVLEVLLGQPPPPPPPNVPALDETSAVAGGRTLSVRERMEQHRANPFCASCHKVIDPIGLALENFDPTGHYRINDNGVPVDASGDLYDGTKLNGLAGLDAALVAHQDTFLRVFTENLMAYALGRQVEYFDMPTVRAIVAKAAANGNRFSSFVLGVVGSQAFQMSRAEAVATARR